MFINVDIKRKEREKEEKEHTDNVDKSFVDLISSKYDKYSKSNGESPKISMLEMNLMRDFNAAIVTHICNA